MASPPTTPPSHTKTAPRNGPTTIINIPPPPSYPDTPEPGTPTSTTTSLSAISTVAIKDGHRGHGLQAHRGHAHQNSTNSLDAERADRISRLAGLERVSTLRAPVPQVHHPSNPNTNPSSSSPAAGSPHPTPTSTGFYPPNHHHQHQQPPYSHPLQQYQYATAAISNPPHAFFDANGQPTVLNKISTVGTASATSCGTGGTGGGSIGVRTFAASTNSDDRDDDDEGTLPDRDEDMLSMDTNIQSIGNDSEAGGMMDPEDIRSRGGGFDDRMSDDGTASLVGFGEGANSTVSGPIYQRRPMPPGGMTWAASGGLERSGSGLSEAAMMARRERDRERERDFINSSGGGGGAGGGVGGVDTPMSMIARDREAACMAMNGGLGSDPPDNDDGYYETANGGAGDAVQPTSAARGGVAYPGSPTTRETVEPMARERLDRGESRPAATPAVANAGQSQRLGQLYFEDRT